jgi:membrane protein
MKQTGFFKGVRQSLFPSLQELRGNDPLRMAGATAFFMTFALPPIIFIIIHIFGLFISPRNVGRVIIDRVTNTLGEEGARQVRQVLRSIRGFSDRWYLIAIGFVFLLFVATTLFGVIKNSLNQIWQISVKKKPGIVFGINLRLRSLGVIMLAGVLVMTDVMIESVEIFAGDIIDKIQVSGGRYYKSALNEVAGGAIVAIWFIVLFRFLADGRPTWKAAIIGGVLTGFLFTAGKLLLWYVLINSNITHVFGASGSFVLVLLFVFYSSFILYYGASFIYVYSIRNDLPITPTGKAFAYTIEEVPAD